jgi:hypothetical protein
MDTQLYPPDARTIAYSYGGRTCKSALIKSSLMSPFTTSPKIEVRTGGALSVIRYRRISQRGGRPKPHEARW